MRNTTIWSLTIAAGRKFETIEELTKKEVKAMFERLAYDTSKNIHNDYVDLLIIKRNDDEQFTMERIGNGEYSYSRKGYITLSGYEAAQMIASI